MWRNDKVSLKEDIIEWKKELQKVTHTSKKGQQLIKKINAAVKQIGNKPSKKERDEFTSWNEATGWVNKRKEDLLFKVVSSRRQDNAPESLGMAKWSYNKEEWIKQKRREESE